MSEFTLPYISAPNEISNEAYHSGAEYEKFISSSELKQMLVSPKWFKFAQEHPSDTRTISLENAMKGSLYHDMLCSIVNTGDMSGFENDWVVFEPSINPKTGKSYGIDSQAYQSIYQEFVANHPGKSITSEAEVAVAKKMIQELRFGNPHLSKDINLYIKNGIAEVSKFVEYEGLFFKFRTDLETPTRILDWKTCGSEVPKIENWAKQVTKLGYDISAAFYQFMEHEITGLWKPFYWVAQEKDPPYDFNIIDASNWAYEINLHDQTAIPHIGAMKLRKLLDAYIKCTREDVWPGYSVFTLPQIYNGKEHRVATVNVPGYAQGEMLNYYL